MMTCFPHDEEGDVDLLGVSPKGHPECREFDSCGPHHAAMFSVRFRFWDLTINNAGSRIPFLSLAAGNEGKQRAERSGRSGRRKNSGRRLQGGAEQQPSGETHTVVTNQLFIITGLLADHCGK